jgi:putative ABC transport system permease protein
VWRDLKFAARSLRRTPTFTAVAVLALALAIGANAAIFSLVDGLWFRPPGIQHPGDIVRVFGTIATSRSALWSFPEYEALRDRTSSFAGVIARGRRGAVEVGANGQSTLLLVNVVSLNFFTTLGVTPEYGRLFGPDDADALARQPGVVLGHTFWERRYGGDPAVVGRTVPLGGRTVTILGVLPGRFREIEPDADRDLWMPPETWMLLSDASEFQQRDVRWFDVLARRRPGVSVATANDEVSALAASLAQTYPSSNQGRGARVVSDLDYRLEQGGVNAMALLGLVLLVVLITCVNVANLLMSRAAGRTRELAVRVALGAGRRRLIRQLMVESALLGVAGAVAGVLVAMWLIRVLPAFFVTPPGFQSPLLFELDGRVLAFTAVVTLVTTVLFGLMPSWMGARGDLLALTKADPTGAAGRRRGTRLGSVLVAGQVAVSLVMLSAAAVLARSFLQTEQADLGFTRTPVLTAWATSGAVPLATGEAAVQQLEALPGVRRVAVAIRAPLSLSGGGRAQPVVLPDQMTPPANGFPEVKFNAVSANYFETMGTRLVAGRVFTPAEETAGEAVVVVNARFASRFFAGQQAVGQTIRLGGPGGPVHRIIGVVENAVINEIGETPEPYFYVPYWRGRYGEITFLIDAPTGPAGLAAAVSGALKKVADPLEPRQLAWMSQYVHFSASSYRATAALAGSLGLIGLLLTALGLYGVVASRTARRTREIGIRVALGAARGQVLRLVVGEGARVALAGVVVGVPAALVATRLIQSLLFGVSPWDATALVGAVGVLVLVLLAATLVPAWRAVHISPSSALREA